MTSPHRSRATAFAFVVALVLAFATIAPSVDSRSAAGEVNQSRGFRNALYAEGVMEHLQALQDIADAHGGQRLTGHGGYLASVDYFSARATAAGLIVSVYDSVSAQQWLETGFPVVDVLSPLPRSLEHRIDFLTLSFSGGGDVTAALAAPDSALGCNAADWAGFPVGAIALVARGTCTFALKAQNAVAAGAVGVIVYNNNPGVFAGTLTAGGASSVPVVGVSQAVGADLVGLLGGGGATVRLSVSSLVADHLTRTLVAETPGGDPGSVVLFHAGLDAPAGSPGISMASGAAAMLELAETYMAREATPANKLVFVWTAGGGDFMAAQQPGLRAYTDTLSPTERAAIKAAVDVEPIASPNPVRLVSQKAGSERMEQIMATYFGYVGVRADPNNIDAIGRWQVEMLGVPFVALTTHGLVPGLHMGLKSTEQALAFGGTAGAPFDPCFRKPCDTIANVHTGVLDEMLDAAGHLLIHLAKRPFATHPVVTP